MVILKVNVQFLWWSLCSTTSNPNFDTNQTAGKVHICLFGTNIVILLETGDELSSGKFSTRNVLSWNGQMTLKFAFNVQHQKSSNSSRHAGNTYLRNAAPVRLKWPQISWSINTILILTARLPWYTFSINFVNLHEIRDVSLFEKRSNQQKDREAGYRRYPCPIGEV